MGSVIGDPAARVRPRAVAEVACVLALFVATGAAFIVPWGAARDAGDQVPAGSYAMFVDGHASLVRHTDANGEIVEWRSSTVEIMPGFRALSDLPGGFVGAVAEHIAGEGAGISQALEAHDALSQARVGLVSRRILARDGSVKTEIEVQVLDHRGLFALGVQTLGSDQVPTVFTPALPLLPANPAPGTRWSASGRAGSLDYRLDARVSASGPLDVEVGRLDDCITVSLELALELPDGPNETRYLDQYCAGAGWVHGERAGEDAAVYDATSVAGVPLAALPGLPGVPDAPAARPPGDPSAWQLSRIGSAVPLSTTGTATFAPVYISSDPPLVLAATDTGGDLVALSAGGAAGGVAWRHPTAGAIYAPPWYGPTTNRVYVGASDGMLRALDARGLFLWSHATGDSIATRPVVHGGTVVFGSEDGHIYGVSADTGERRWRAEADGAVVSSPAVVDGQVVVADESGAVRALDPATGAVRWTWTAPAAVLAPLAAADTGVLVADASGTITLLDGRGAAVWDADAGRGSSLLTEPAVGDGLVTTIDEQGDLAALSLADGRVAWRRANEDYVGSPTWEGGAFVVADDGGTIDLVDATGAVVTRFDARDASTPTDLPPAFTYGASTGGGALWLADDHGVVRRLGPAMDDGLVPLEVAWAKTILDPPYQGFPLVATPVAWGDRLVLFDARRNLAIVDPASGEGEPAGSFGRDGDSVLAEVLAVGDTLIVDAGVRLMAIDLATGRERWSVPLEGTRFHPPVVAGDAVVVVMAEGDAAVVAAFDLGDGRRLWDRPTGAAALRSGPVPRNGVVFVGDPVEAIDPGTGERRWTSSVGDPAGLPVVVDDLLLVTTFVDGDESGRLAAIETGSGRVRWERDLGGEGHGPLSRLVAGGGVAVLTSITGPVVGIVPGTGEELWRRDLPSALIGTPSAIGDRVWYVLDSGQVLALRPADGAIVLEFEGFGTSIGAMSLVQRPVSVGDVVVIAAGPMVYAVREASR